MAFHIFCVNATRSVGWKARRNQVPGKFLQALVADHVRPNFECSQLRASESPSSATVDEVTGLSQTLLISYFSCRTTSLICNNCVDTLIENFNAETFAQNKIHDASKNTDSHYFCCHGRTNTQRYRDFANCGPLVLVNSFVNDSAAAFSVVLGAAVPEALHCHLSVLLSLSTLPLCTQIRPVISFLIVFPEDVLDVVINL